MTEPPDLSALVAALRAGDPSALQALYDRYAAQLVRYSAFRLGEAEAAQEVVQDVFIQVWQHARAFEYRGEAAWVGWLYTIAHHVVITYLRQRRRRPSVSLDATGAWAPLPSMDLARTVCEREALRQALARLSPLQHQVIMHRYLGGLTNGETAVVLGRTEGAIKALHQRALLRLHQLLTAEPALAERRLRGVRPASPR